MVIYLIIQKRALLSTRSSPHQLQTGVAILGRAMLLRRGLVLALAAAQALAADFRTTGALTENVEDPVQIVFLVTVNASYTNNLHPSRLSGH